MIQRTFEILDEAREWLTGPEVSAMDKPAYCAYYDELNDNFVIFIKTADEGDVHWEENPDEA